MWATCPKCSVDQCSINPSTSPTHPKSRQWIPCSVSWSVLGVFNQPLNFQTSNATAMQLMFSETFNFNQPVNFSTGNVLRMDSMFRGAQVFNQPINFDGSNLIDASNMSAGIWAPRWSCRRPRQRFLNCSVRPDCLVGVGFIIIIIIFFVRRLESKLTTRSF